MARESIDPHPAPRPPSPLRGYGARAPGTPHFDPEALLRAEMAVVPSAAFLPRVRERVAEERVRPRLLWSWFAPGVVLPAAAAFAAVLMAPADAVPPAAPPAPLLAVASAPGPVTMPVLESVRPLPDQRVLALDGRPPASPAIIVDPRQRAAIDALVRLTYQGKFEEGSAAASPTLLQPIAETVVPVAVAPVQVSPIGAGGVMQTGTESTKPPRPAEAGFSKP
jgi:hypothetical protein